MNAGICAAPAETVASGLEEWALSEGFDAVSVADVDLGPDEAGLAAWLAAGFHGEMEFMHRHRSLRSRPADLIPGTLRVITVRARYLAQMPAEAATAQSDRGQAYIARYALGRDYHKVLRRKLQRLASRIEEAIGPYRYRVFVDSAPVMEVALARKAGLGWRGKHTLLLTRDEGSFFFLGEIYTDLPLPVSAPAEDHCGRCEACIDACPTRAIVAPYRLDARRCISYLTIELKGSIPVEFRRLIGNRIFGCDDCQLACPWNRFARLADAPEFRVREGLDRVPLLALFGWSAAEFELRMAGSAIRRVGHSQWLRNVAVALGNAPHSPDIVTALAARADDPSALVREHVAWALAEQFERAAGDGVQPRDAAVNPATE